MRGVLTSTLLIILATHTLAQKRTEPKVPPRPTPGRVTGTVLCADTHAPARNAVVFLSPVPDANGDSPADDINSISHARLDGTYTVTQVPPGPYIVLAILPGYLSPIQQLFDASSPRGETDTDANRAKRLAIFPHILVESGKTTTFDIALDRAAAISGTVLYDDGSPAMSINLRLEPVTPTQADKEAEKLPGASMRVVGQNTFANQNFSTDDRGHYRIASVPPGNYRISAMVRAGLARDYTDMSYLGSSQLELTALRAYARNTLHRADAQAVELKAGDEVRDVDITIPLHDLHRLRGTLAATDGRTVSTAQLTLTDAADESISFSNAPSSDGTFEFPTVPNGTYALTVTEAEIQISIPGGRTRFPNHKTLNTFADTTLSVNIKDADQLDLSVALKEVPMVRKPNAKPKDDEDEDEPK